MKPRFSRYYLWLLYLPQLSLHCRQNRAILNLFLSHYEYDRLELCQTIERSQSLSNKLTFSIHAIKRFVESYLILDDLVLDDREVPHRWSDFLAFFFNHFAL